MKKLLLGLTLLLGGVFCYSCGTANNASIDLEETATEEIVDVDQDYDIPEVIKNKNTEEDYIFAYYDFLDTFKHQGHIYTGLALDPNSYIKVNNNVYGINTDDLKVTGDKSGVLVSFTYSSEKKSFNIAAAGQDWDIIAATLESFIMRDYSQGVARLYNCNFEIDSQNISCTGLVDGSSDIYTCMSFDSNGYLTRYKGLSFNNIQNTETYEITTNFIECDLIFNWSK